MITDEIIEAIDKLAGLMELGMHKAGVNSVREMLCDFDESQWLKMNEEERKEWLEQFLC